MVKSLRQASNKYAPAPPSRLATYSCARHCWIAPAVVSRLRVNTDGNRSILPSQCGEATLRERLSIPGETPQDCRRFSSIVGVDDGVEVRELRYAKR